MGVSPGILGGKTDNSTGVSPYMLSRAVRSHLGIKFSEAYVSHCILGRAMIYTLR